VAAGGRAFAGRGTGPDGRRHGWRVRLDETRCPNGPPVDLVAHQRAATLFEQPNGIAVDSQNRVYVAGFHSRNVVRLDGSFSTFPAPDAEEVLALDDGGPEDRPLVLGVGPDDALYVSAFERRQLIRIAADGTRSTVFDGSGYPYLGHPAEEVGFLGVPTTPFGVAFGPDGAIYLNALARVLRIDLDAACTSCST
jgi:DNA-binding beta-propeller fold protein YncE